MYTYICILSVVNTNKITPSPIQGMRVQYYRIASWTLTSPAQLRPHLARPSLGTDITASMGLATQD